MPKSKAVTHCPTSFAFFSYVEGFIKTRVRVKRAECCPLRLHAQGLIEAGQWDKPTQTRLAPDPLLLLAAGQGGPWVIDGANRRRRYGSRCFFPEQQFCDALMSLVQALIVGVAATAAVGVLLRQKAVVVAVMLTHHQRQLRWQMLIDDQL